MKYLIGLILLTSFNPTFSQETPKLMVGIVVDQMCYDYLYRFQSKFGPDGFNKIMNKGANCRNVNYNYVPTFTGPGHASIYTGTTPSNHGIVANDWYSNKEHRVINCVEDQKQLSVGTSSNEGQCSPLNLKTTTITDQLKMTYPQAKVISVSIKDRGAILPGGHLSDGSYWYDYASGNFITSTFFKKELPIWVKTFNEMGKVEDYMRSTWSTLYPIETYTESGPDNSVYEMLLAGKTKPEFPYDLNQVPRDKRFEVFPYTPFANSLLTDFALSALKQENLGKGKQTDFLCISYSTPDLVGHAFGPYSVELEDVYLRLDQNIAQLLKTLDKQLGKDAYTLFITADHAVVPVPQYLVDHNLPGGYLFLDKKVSALRQKVNEKFGVDFIQSIENLNVYFKQNLLDSLKIDQKQAEEFVAGYIQKWEGVKQVFTAYELLHSNPSNRYAKMVQNGFHPKESGSVLFILESGFLPKSRDTETAHKGTSHGSAFNYDTHVPLLWYGKNIRKQSVYRSIEITDISATLTHFLNLQRTGAMTGEPIVELLEKDD